MLIVKKSWRRSLEGGGEERGEGEGEEEEEAEEGGGGEVEEGKVERG